MLPKHIHKVTWKSGTAAYYWQKNRGTTKAGPRVRLPDDPNSAAFWAAIKAQEAGRFSVTRKNGTKSKQRITNPIRQLLDNSGYLYCGSA